MRFSVGSVVKCGPGLGTCTIACETNTRTTGDECRCECKDLPPGETVVILMPMDCFNSGGNRTLIPDQYLILSRFGALVTWFWRESGGFRVL